jgi:hypothetical protein
MDLQAKLLKLSFLKEEINALSEKKKEFDDLKSEIMFDMAASKSKRTESVNGIYAVRAERTDIKVIDQEQVKQWLTDNEFVIDEYVRLDLTRVSPLVKSALKETGELVPGTEVQTNEYISVKEDK